MKTSQCVIAGLPELPYTTVCFILLPWDNILCCSSLLIFPGPGVLPHGPSVPLESLWSTHLFRPEARGLPKHNAIIISTVNVPRVVLALHILLWLHPLCHLSCAEQSDTTIDVTFLFATDQLSRLPVFLQACFQHQDVNFVQAMEWIYQVMTNVFSVDRYWE